MHKKELLCVTSKPVRYSRSHQFYHFSQFVRIEAINGVAEPEPGDGAMVIEADLRHHNSSDVSGYY